MNKVSEISGTQQYSTAKVYTSNAIFVLAIASLLMVTFVLLISPQVDWASIFNVQLQANDQEVASSINLLICIFALGLPFIVAEKFLEGNQKGYVSNLWQSVGNFLSLGGILLAVQFRLGIPGLIAATLGIPVLVRIINFVVQFWIRHSWALPSVRFVDKSVILALLRPGLIFFCINVFHMIGYNSDNFIIARMLDVSAVSLYGVVQKISLLSLVFSSFTTSLWPAYTESLARKDFDWVKKTIRRTVVINLLLGAAIGIILTALGPWAIPIWTGGAIVPPVSLLVGFSFYIIVNGLVGCFAIIYNSSHLLKWQLPLIIVSAVTSVPIKIFLCAYWGVTGVVWGTVISYSLFYLLPSVFIIRKLFTSNLNTQK
jgi:O-antigen/teichoic acid export membrane protein